MEIQRLLPGHSPFSNTMVQALLCFRLPNEKDHRLPSDKDRLSLILVESIFGTEWGNLLSGLQARDEEPGPREATRQMLLRHFAHDRTRLLAEFRSHLDMGNEFPASAIDYRAWIKGTISAFPGNDASLLAGMLHALHFAVVLPWLEHIANGWSIEVGRLYVRSYRDHTEKEVQDIWTLTMDLQWRFSMIPPLSGHDGSSLAIRSATDMIAWCFPYAYVGKKD
jgi:hypothetical protein